MHTPLALPTAQLRPEGSTPLSDTRYIAGGSGRTGRLCGMAVPVVMAALIAGRCMRVPWHCLIGRICSVTLFATTRRHDLHLHTCRLNPSTRVDSIPSHRFQPPRTLRGQQGRCAGEMRLHGAGRRTLLSARAAIIVLMVTCVHCASSLETSLNVRAVPNPTLTEGLSRPQTQVMRWQSEREQESTFCALAATFVRIGWARAPHSAARVLSHGCSIVAHKVEAEGNVSTRLFRCGTHR